MVNILLNRSDVEALGESRRGSGSLRALLRAHGNLFPTPRELHRGHSGCSDDGHNHQDHGRSVTIFGIATKEVKQ